MSVVDVQLISKKDSRYLVSLCGPWEIAKELPRLIGVVYDADDEQWLPPINLDRVLSRAPWQTASLADEQEFAGLIARHPIPVAFLQRGAELLAESRLPLSVTA